LNKYPEAQGVALYICHGTSTGPTLSNAMKVPVLSFETKVYITRDGTTYTLDPWMNYQIDTPTQEK
jgi:hypothetical protein